MQTAAVADSRDKVFNVRLSDEEHARLMRVAEHYGLNAAHLLRFLLKREEADLGLAPEPPPPPRKPARKAPPKQ